MQAHQKHQYAETATGDMGHGIADLFGPCVVGKLSVTDLGSLHCVRRLSLIIIPQ